MPKRTKAKKPARRPLPDASQNALSVVERAIGGRLKPLNDNYGDAKKATKKKAT
jgi:hypothetical protein